MGPDYWVPTVVQNGHYLDIYSAMLADGIIFVNAPIDQRIAGLVASGLLNISSRGRRDVQPKLYLNTKKGDLVSAMSVVDIVEHYKRSQVVVETVGLGEVGVAAALIIAAGAKGWRGLAPHSQVSLYVGLDQFDLPNIKSGEMRSKQGERVKSDFVRMFAAYTGQDPALFRVRMNSEEYLDAEQAKALGIADRLV